jgi:thioredoxin-like negative regulator of GroEL
MGKDIYNQIYTEVFKNQDKQSMKQIIYFSADWCNPCRTLGPIMENVKKTVPVHKINIDYDTINVAQFNVKSIPTVIILENGQEVSRFTGIKSEAEILNMIR